MLLIAALKISMQIHIAYTAARDHLKDKKNRFLKNKTLNEDQLFEDIFQGVSE